MNFQEWITRECRKLDSFNERVTTPSGTRYVVRYSVLCVDSRVQIRHTYKTRDEATHAGSNALEGVFVTKS